MYIEEYWDSGRKYFSIDLDDGEAKMCLSPCKNTSVDLLNYGVQDFPRAKVMYVDYIRVSPRYRNSGYGSLLLKACLKWARIAQTVLILDAIGIDSGMDSARLRNFYLRHDFKMSPYRNTTTAMYHHNRKRSMNKQEISSLIRNACAELGVKLTIGRGKSVKVGNIRCSGFFDDEIPELAIATGRDEYLGTFIHEYNHMMQWKEQIPAWVALDACRGCQNFDLWMDGMEFDMPAVNKFIDRIIDIEMDCEKRTVDFIVQNGVDIDVSEYIKKANSYVLFYNHARETRKWYHRNRKPYEVFEVWSAMPDTFVENPYFLTDAQKTLYVQYT